jgi:hypothetical protein
MKVTERIEEHYETQEVPFGKVSAWRPGRVMIECDCGERLTLTGSTTVCACGVDLTSTLRGTLSAKQSRDEDLHPGATLKNARIRDASLRGFSMKSSEYDPRLSAPKYHAERRASPYDEEGTNWVGVFIALIGVALMALSFVLDGSFF